MVESSKALDKLFYSYTHLPIGGKELSCPYWMNKLKNRISGPLGGKGQPEQIVLATEEAAKKSKLNLSDMSEKEIVEFMKKKRIGIDCSGLAFWLLNELDIEKGGNGICDDIPGSRGKSLCRANVLMLTAEDVSAKVEEINKIQVGDMIRLSAGKHIAIVLKILREDGPIKEIGYAHSSAITFISGVHSDKIIIKDETLPLHEQNWLERTKKGKDYKTKLILNKGDGIRRLKIWI